MAVLTHDAIQVFDLAKELSGPPVDVMALLSSALAIAIIEAGVPPESRERVALSVGPVVAKLVKALTSPDQAPSH